MQRKIFNIMVMSISILLVNLLTTYISDYFMSYQSMTDPLKFTAIGMLVLIAVFYPAFEYLDKFSEKVTARFLKKGKSLFGKTLGMIIVYILLLFIFYCVYAHLWFHVDVFRMIIHSLFY